MNDAPASAGPRPEELGIQPTESLCGGDVPLPVLGGRYGQVDMNHQGFDTNAEIRDDGRLNVNINERNKKLSSLLSPVLQKVVGRGVSERHRYVASPLAESIRGEPVPSLNIVIQIVGSRGDVQPFVALGQVLKNEFGHRIRLATHPTFKQFVEENGLEFFDIGGDPTELMAFMVKNPGLMPGVDTLRNGDVGKRRKEIAHIISRCWRSCFEGCQGAGFSDFNNSRISCEGKPFIADVIIANPPSFAHIHCAEKLGIPLHLMFTMPWSPTQAFPHPLVNIQFSNAEIGVANFVSYALVEMMTWQGLGDIINRFRERTLGLEPINILSAPGMIPRLRIPYTYCWSPTLIPKPKDWGPNLDISGFFFLPLSSSYIPPDDLSRFLEAGPPPVYIGFGSIVVDDPNAMTNLIFEAVKITGQRAIVSKGWGGFGSNEIAVPDDVFMVGNCPHDWLFKRVSCVVHHGGAGTTAAGIALGRPTVVVPFFGDQPFWGAMVAKAGAGPTPIPHKQLTAERLAVAIMSALELQSQHKAEELGAKIRQEHGLEEGAKSFHNQLQVDTIRCMFAPRRAAAWRVKRSSIILSPFALAVLNNEGILGLDDVKLYRSREYDTSPGPHDPITGGAAALIESLGDFVMGFADVPAEILKAIPLPASYAQANLNKIKPHPPLSRSSSLSSLGQTPSPSDASSASLPSTITPSDIDTDQVAVAETLPRKSTESGSSGNSEQDHPNDRCIIKEVSPQAKKFTAREVVGAAHAATKLVAMGLRSPMNFSLGVAKGFHNAPKLYGDKTVREHPNITGFRSGVKAAGKEIGYGFYDGISGLVTQPLEGSKEGPVGFVKGVGKGFGGLVLKPGAGIFALTGYTMRGIYKELQKHLGPSVDSYIIASRCAQGCEDLRDSTYEERVAVVEKWHSSVREEILRHSSSFHALSELVARPRDAVALERRTRHIDSGLSRSDSDLTANYVAAPESARETMRAAGGTPPAPKHKQKISHLPDSHEQAISEAVRVSSTGDANEDRMIGRAIRASLSELRAAEAAGDHENAYNRAIKASIDEAQCARQDTAHAHIRDALPQHSNGDAVDLTLTSTSDDEDKDLKLALHESAQSHREEQERDQQHLNSHIERAIWNSLIETAGSTTPTQQTHDAADRA